MFEKYGFVRLEHESPDLETLELAEEYRGFNIFAEYPNGGMLAINIFEIYNRVWWSYPTDQGLDPSFDYDEDQKAFLWAQSVIDEVLDENP